jgi:amphi-Trp domain-containing protein
MPEDVLFTTERRQSRQEIASSLRQVAGALDEGRELTFEAGDQSITVDPPARPTFEMEVEREGPADGSGELSVEFELEWDEDATDDGDLTIE